MENDQKLLIELSRKGYTTEQLQKELGGGYSICFLNRVRNGTAPLSKGLSRGIKFILANPGIDRRIFSDGKNLGIQA